MTATILYMYISWKAEIKRTRFAESATSQQPVLSIWIWICTYFGGMYTDPDPGGQNDPQKRKKVINVLFFPVS